MCYLISGILPEIDNTYKKLRKQAQILTPKPNIKFYSKFYYFLGPKLYSVIQDKMKISKTKYIFYVN